MLSEFSVFLRGSCRFEAEGDFPERFLNLCSRADMGLWDIVRREHGISARVIAGKYRRLLPFARRCGVRLRVRERYGLPFRLTPYRLRPGMPLGFMLFCAALWFLSLFIWSVETPPLSPETTQKLDAALEEMDVTVGSLRSHIDAKRMAVELQMKVPELTWAGISTYGSRLSVDAKEYEPVNLAPAAGEPCNLVASCDGVILEIEPLRGSVEVVNGQPVAKGDLLVSGVVEHLDGTVQITDASAVVWASTSRTLTCSMPYRQLESRRTGRVVTTHRVKLFGLELPLIFSADTDGLFEHESSYKRLTVGGLDLPFEVRTQRSYELKQYPVTYTPEQAGALALEELERRIDDMGDVVILDRKAVTEQTDSGVTVKLQLTVRENIAVPSAIGIQ